MYIFNMRNIYHIKYVDAFYVYVEKIKNTKPSIHEAYGYVLENGIHAVIVFVKEKPVLLRVDNKKSIAEGLVIPRAAALPYNPLKHKSLEKKFSKIKKGDRVTVTWNDISHIVNEPQYICAAMYTEGIVYSLKKDRIVLRDPETIRTYPLPIRNHPEKKPTFYVIPKSFVTNISSI